MFVYIFPISNSFPQHKLCLFHFSKLSQVNKLLSCVEAPILNCRLVVIGIWHRGIKKIRKPVVAIDKDATC